MCPRGIDSRAELREPTAGPLRAPGPPICDPEFAASRRRPRKNALPAVPVRQRSR
jgi:hypothetical protein